MYLLLKHYNINLNVNLCLSVYCHCIKALIYITVEKGNQGHAFDFMLIYSSKYLKTKHIKVEHFGYLPYHILHLFVFPCLFLMLSFFWIIITTTITTISPVTDNVCQFGALTSQCIFTEALRGRSWATVINPLLHKRKLNREVMWFDQDLTASRSSSGLQTQQYGYWAHAF